MSVIKIGRSSGSILRFSVVNRFGRNFGSDNVGSINLKKKYIFGSLTFDFGSNFRVGSHLNNFDRDHRFFYFSEIKGFTFEIY